MFIKQIPIFSPTHSPTRIRLESQTSISVNGQTEFQFSSNEDMEFDIPDNEFVLRAYTKDSELYVEILVIYGVDDKDFWESGQAKRHDYNEFTKKGALKKV